MYYCNILLTEFKKNKKSILRTWIILLAMFLLGEAILFVIINTSPEAEYFPLGTFMTLLCFILLSWLLIMSEFSSGFGSAIKMGITRKAYLFSAFIFSWIFLFSSLLLIIGLYKMECMIFKDTYFSGSLENFDDFTENFFTLKGIFITAVFLVATSSAYGAALQRFRQKALWVFCFSPILFQVALNSKIADSMKQAVANMLPEVWYVLGSIFVAACIFFTVVILRKQAVVE